MHVGVVDVALETTLFSSARAFERYSGSMRDDEGKIASSRRENCGVCFDNSCDFVGGRAGGGR